MIRFRGNSNSLGDLAMMQVLKGLGLGLISFPTQVRSARFCVLLTFQTAVQVASKHERALLLMSAVPTAQILP